MHYLVAAFKYVNAANAIQLKKSTSKLGCDLSGDLQFFNARAGAVAFRVKWFSLGLYVCFIPFDSFAGCCKALYFA